ncbi:MAG: DUF1573 domain-containing protein [Bacteroidaceae bacterium]
MRRIYNITGILCGILFFSAARLNAQALFVPDAEIQKVGDVAFQTQKRITLGFRNRGDKPLRLIRVHPSCNCLDVQYPSQSIPAGGHAEITLTFNAEQLGSFYRDVEIFTDASDKPVYMAIQGNVVTEVADYGQDFPIDLGNVRLQTNYVEFDDVNRGDKPSVEIEVVNLERTAYRPTLMHLPPYLSAESIPEDIPGGKTGRIRITLDSGKLPLLGLNQTSIYLARYVGDKISDTNEIYVNSVLLPDFSHMSAEQIANSPELQVESNEVDLGSIGQKEKLTKTLILYNSGRSPLHFKQVQVFNKAVSVSLGNRILKPGKSTKLKVTVIAKYLKKAKSRPRVLLITDDPKHSKEIININVQP